ncbi:hypothetical protein JCM1840_002063 [Sporobolomyces johnsonii]
MLECSLQHACLSPLNPRSLIDDTKTGDVKYWSLSSGINVMNPFINDRCKENDTMRKVALKAQLCKQWNQRQFLPEVYPLVAYLATGNKDDKAVNEMVKAIKKIIDEVLEVDPKASVRSRKMGLHSPITSVTGLDCFETMYVFNVLPKVAQPKNIRTHIRKIGETLIQSHTRLTSAVKGVKKLSPSLPAHKMLHVAMQLTSWKDMHTAEVIAAIRELSGSPVPFYSVNTVHTSNSPVS